MKPVSIESRRITASSISIILTTPNHVRYLVFLPSVMDHIMYRDDIEIHCELPMKTAEHWSRKFGLLDDMIHLEGTVI